MENNEVLKPCPFCNGLAYSEKTVCDYTIRCTLCSAVMVTKNDNNCAIAKPSASDLWNNRASTNTEMVRALEFYAFDITDDFNTWINRMKQDCGDYALKALSQPSKPAMSRDEHTDDIAVDRFSSAMKAKLAKKRNEGGSGWDDETECSIEWLIKLLVEHIHKGDPVDIANFCMMIYCRGTQMFKPPYDETRGLLEEVIATIENYGAVNDIRRAKIKRLVQQALAQPSKPAMTREELTTIIQKSVKSNEPNAYDIITALSEAGVITVKE